MQNDRKTKEMQSLFADRKFSRQAWQSVGQAILNNPATRVVREYNKEGEETVNSMIQNYSYNKLYDDIQKLGKENREPTELEMILQCQIVKARTDTSAAVFIRDTLGAKPVDETKLDAQLSNPYEQLTDEELELIAAHREKLATDNVQALPAGARDDNIIIQECVNDTTYSGR